MRDGFLATMVAQFKKNQSRLSMTPSVLSSRSPSALSVAPTPIPRLRAQEIETINNENSSSESSTPSISNQKGSSSIVQQPISRSLVAKCQSCSIRGELIVCSHCENVICIKCAEEHKSVINADVKREWELCKTQFQTIIDKSSIIMFLFIKNFLLFRSVLF